MTAFSIPTPKIPTDEEVNAATLHAWQRVEPTLLSGLHPEILRLSIPTRFFSVPVEEMNQHWLGCFDGQNTGVASDRLVQMGRDALAEYPDGVFFKLDSRSPKDWGIVRFTAENIHDLPGVFFGSERIMDDICVQRYHRPAIVLCFRQWIELGEEYRVFVREREIQGISRYDYANPPRVEHTPELIGEIEATAARYLTAINPHFPLDHFVFDFSMTPDGSVLIEINPYGLSDPCLFRSYEEIRGVAA